MTSPESVQVATVSDEHVAWLRYKSHDGGRVTIHLCDSDSPGAFKVFRTPSSPVAREATLEAELHNIAEAKRFDRDKFDDDSNFADWAQSRARFTLAANERPQPVNGVESERPEPVSALPEEAPKVEASEAAADERDGNYPYITIPLPQGVQRMDGHRLAEILSGYGEFQEPTMFEIRSLAYEVRNWRMRSPAPSLTPSLAADEVEILRNQLQASQCAEQMASDTAKEMAKRLEAATEALEEIRQGHHSPRTTAMVALAAIKSKGTT